MTSSDNPQAAVCNSVPASGIICDSECGDWWYQCAHGVPMLKPVPAGTKCKDSNFVVKAVCSAFSPTTAAPVDVSSTSASESAALTSTPSTTLAPAPAPTPAPTPSPTPSPSSTTAAPTPAPTTPASPTATPALECGQCTACLADNGVCYSQGQAFCDLYPQYIWCGPLGRTNL